jgi:hypothetical protein
VSIPGGGYLAVAASASSFQANYPGVSNVVAGWTGSLANSDETIELETALGRSSIPSTMPAKATGPGASAAMARRPPPSPATAPPPRSRSFQHTFSGNDQVIISGAINPNTTDVLSCPATGSQ